jgi:diguanylate cyclase (GGDEF)-like protein/PAS domain S-box-containing protein
MPMDILPRLLAESDALLTTLDRVMAMAEFSAAGELVHANGSYLSILGYTPGSGRRLHHRALCEESYAASPAYDEFWNRLLAGKPVSELRERRRNDGSGCWIEATYAPVPGHGGRVDKIIEIATDVTERVDRERRLDEETRRLSMVADATDNAVVITGGDWCVVYVNYGFVRMFGWAADEILGRTPIAMLAPEAVHLVEDEFHAPLLAGQSVRREEMLRGRGGERYWCSLITNPIFDANGVLINTVSVITDITQSKMHEVLQHRVLEAMALEQPLTEVVEMVCREIERIVPDVATAIREVDADGRLHTLASPKLAAAHGHGLDGRQIGEHAGSCGAAAARGVAVGSADIATDPLWAGCNGELLALGYRACWSTPICSLEGRVVGTLAFHYQTEHGSDSFREQLANASVRLCALAFERQRARLRIRQLAFYDTLTNLPNRSLLHAKADQAIANAARTGDCVAVVFIDLDRFKQVNDSLGHPAGDELLRIVAGRLVEDGRKHDIAGRRSGDEFVLVLPQVDATQTTDLVERLQARLSSPCEVGGVDFAPSASVGIAMFPVDGRDMETLLHRADMAMYQAKRGGRGRFSFFSNEMNVLAQERIALEKALRVAIQTETLELHYQPQVDLKTGLLYGVEALARWHHPELGEISPARFIPLAEECGLIDDLGRWALQMACGQLSTWRARGVLVPAVSVNLSPTSFHNLALPQMIADTLKDNALSPQSLTLEITENVLLDTHPSTLKTIGEVRAQGVRLAMDDFGTGYSSLSYLRRLPLNELKLDRSFVSDLGDDETARALSDAVVQIGKSMRLTVVAEGVETDEQESILREQGYDVAQGYLFARPLPPERLEHWIKERAKEAAAALLL